MNFKIIQTSIFYLFIWVIKPIASFGLSCTYYGAYLTIAVTDYILSLFIKECEQRNQNFLHRLKKYLHKLTPYPGVYTQASNSNS